MEHKEHVIFRSKFGNWSFQQAIRQVEAEKKLKGSFFSSFVLFLLPGFMVDLNLSIEPVIPPFDVSSMFFQSERLEQQSRKRKADAGWADTHQQVTAERDSSGEDGEVKIWMVRSSKLVLLDPRDHPGHFYSSESYVIKYVWEFKEKTRCVFYTWQGRDAQGVSALSFRSQHSN